MPDVPEMKQYAVGDADFPELGAERTRQRAGIVISTVRRTEARHGDCHNAVPWQGRHVTGLDHHQKGQCRIQSARKTDDHLLTIDMGNPFFQAQCLNGQDFITALVAVRG